jgi:hypothetical protein
MKTRIDTSASPGRKSSLAPAYYLGRPAAVWIKAMERRHPNAEG